MGRTYLANLSGSRLGDRICPARDMSGLGAEHVWEMPLESSPEAGYVSLTQEKVDKPDMSGLGLDMSGLGSRHVREMPLESGPEVGYVWLTQEKAERPDMFGLGAGHVWPESLESG
jgi:hypothetical protein